VNDAERGYRERQRRRHRDDAEVDAPRPDAASLREDQARVAFGGHLRRELRGLLGEEQNSITKLREIADDPARRGAELAASRLVERRLLALEIVNLAARYELTSWLRLGELDPADRRALGV
jgi:hypothetical protein